MSVVRERNGPSVLKRLWPVVKVFAWSLLIVALMGQCSATAQINQKLSKLEDRPVAVSIGKNSFAQVGQPLSAEENATEFLSEVLPLLQSFTNKLPKEMDSECKRDPNCNEGQDRGVSFDGVELPTLVGVASNVVVPSYRKSLLPALLKNAERTIGRKVNWKAGEAVAYTIFEVHKKDSKTYEVKGGYYHYSAKGQPIAAYEHDVLVTLRQIIPPRPNSNVTNVQEVIATALSRGYMIEFIEVI